MRLADLVKYTPQPVYINCQETPKKPKKTQPFEPPDSRTFARIVREGGPPSPGQELFSVPGFRARTTFGLPVG